jgi:ribonucleoside-diphosphate reductase alpha chain
MERIVAREPEAFELWKEILRTRVETGEPFLFFTDNVNRNSPPGYIKHGLTVKTSNICLLGEELVTTSEGPKAIKELVGKTVTIWDGEKWVENSSFGYKGHANQLVEVTFRDGSKTRTTLNHRFPTEAFGFVEAKDLKHGMTVETHTIQYSGNVELEAAYLKGFLTADGTSHNDKPILWLYDTKYMCQERILSAVNSLPADLSYNEGCITEAGVRAAGDNRVNVLGLTARKNNLLPWCKEYKKELPKEYLDWTLNSKAEFLAGVFDGDGTVVNNSYARCYQLASVHKGFLEQVQLLLKSIGVQSTLNCMREAGKTNFNDGYGDYPTLACYRLTVSNSSAYKLADICHFSRLVKLERPTKRGAYKTKPTHGVVKSVEIIDVEPVATYCTEVPSTHKFALTDGRMTGNCTEVTGYTDVEHTFVCCLSSMNLTKWWEWKDTKAVYYATWFLEGVMMEFIAKAEDRKGFASAVRFAKKSHMLGLGVLGYHSLLQKERLPFESYGARLLNRAIFKHLAKETHEASKDMAKEYGEPEWCKGTGVRNTHTTALAPTVSNSLVCGHVSAGIEPWAANCFEKRGAKGVVLFYNPICRDILASYGQDTAEVWDSICKEKGSVQHLDFLSEEDKEILLTAREICQMEIVEQAAERQKLMDSYSQGQAQSVNLFFSKDVDPTYYAKVHYRAWSLGLKTLYYCRNEQSSNVHSSEKLLKKMKRVVNNEPAECTACHG